MRSSGLGPGSPWLHARAGSPIPSARQMLILAYAVSIVGQYQPAIRHRRLRDRLRSRLAGNQGSATMPITPYLKGPYYFDLETRRALGIALEMACIALSAGDDDEADHRR